MNADDTKMEAQCASGCAGAALPTASESPGLDDAAAGELSVMCKALSHPVRIQIIQHLMGIQGCMCGGIVDRFDLAQSTVSQHLKVLKQSGLVQGEVEGTKVCYCLNPEAIKRFRGLLDSLLSV